MTADAIHFKPATNLALGPVSDAVPIIGFEANVSPMPPDRTAALANTSAGACQPRGRQLRVAHRVGDRDLTSGSGPKTFHVRRLKGSNDSVHTLDRDEVSALRKLKASSMSPYVFTSERGAPLDAWPRRS
jgi:hypothetical protein